MAIYDQEGQNGQQDQNSPSGRKVENGEIGQNDKIG